MSSEIRGVEDAESLLIFDAVEGTIETANADGGLSFVALVGSFTQCVHQSSYLTWLVEVA
jgi:hypothetical protein